MLKKILYILAGVVLFTSIAYLNVSKADEAVELIINGKRVDCEQIIDNGCVFLPARIIAEELGAEVTWNNEENEVIISQNQGDRYLKGELILNNTALGIGKNIITATELNGVFDNRDKDLVNYREGYNDADLLPSNPLVVDLRKKEDYDVSHIPGAIWLDEVENIANTDNVIKLKRLLEKHIKDGGKNEIVVYCYTGNTSGLAAGVLGANGLPIRNLKNGFDISWKGTYMLEETASASVEDGNSKTCLNNDSG